MERIHWLSIIALFAIAGCKKDEVKEYTVTLDARCWDCVVTYAAGADFGKSDTILGTISGTDTLTASRQYQLIVLESENIFFRGCRLDPDTSFGEIELHATGPIQPLSATAGLGEACATINQPVQVQ